MPSSQQHLVFAGSYAAADQPGIFAWEFNEVTGALTPCGTCAGVANPSFLAVHPNRRFLYSVSETSQQDGAPGGVWAFQFDRPAETGPVTFQPLNHRASGGDAPCHLQLDSTGQWLVVSNYSSGSVGVFPILPDGSLGAMSDFDQHQGKSVNPQRQEGPHAHSATWSADDRFIIVADLGTDQLFVYTFDSTAGKLGTPACTATRPGAGPRHMVFHPAHQYVYVANELDSTVSIFDYDAASGALREREALPALPANAPESLVADIHISAVADRMYVSNRGHNSIAVFDVHADGELAQVAIPPCGGNWPRNFALGPGGRFMLVANQYSGDVTVLPVLPGSEPLGAPVEHVAVAQATCVKFVPTYD